MQVLEQVFDDVFHVLLLVWRPLPEQLSGVSALSRMRRVNSQTPRAGIPSTTTPWRGWPSSCVRSATASLRRCPSASVHLMASHDPVKRPLATSREAARPAETCAARVPEWALSALRLRCLGKGLRDDLAERGCVKLREAACSWASAGLCRALWRGPWSATTCWSESFERLNRCRPRLEHSEPILHAFTPLSNLHC